jgi:hypothetical protein
MLKPFIETNKNKEQKQMNNLKTIKYNDEQSIYFELGNQKYNIVLGSYKTRNGFKHELKLYRLNLRQFETTIFYDCKALVQVVKAFYTNRTWEQFTFQSVLLRWVDKHLNDLKLTDQTDEQFYIYKKQFLKHLSFIFKTEFNIFG